MISMKKLYNLHAGCITMLAEREEDTLEFFHEYYDYQTYQDINALIIIPVLALPNFKVHIEKAAKNYWEGTSLNTPKKEQMTKIFFSLTNKKLADCLFLGWFKCKGIFLHLKDNNEYY